MPNERPCRMPRSESAEWIVLDLLVDAEIQRPWSVEEVIREVGSPIAAADALEALRAAGLAHRPTDGFVFATRAAVRYHEITEAAAHE
jgi:hypothetical protein